MLSTASFASLLAATALAYPIDAFEQTGIRRLAWQQGVDNEGFRGRKTPLGARWESDRIKLRMLNNREFDLTLETPKDPELQSALEAILKKWAWRRYNIAILDITDPMKPRFAGVNEERLQTPGSVGKLLVASAFFEQLKKRFPNDIAARSKMLKETMVSADGWALPNHHEVPKISGDKFQIARYRKVEAGDVFSLWEWLDHTLSVSSNAAASMLWRETVLMKLLGTDYPPVEYNDELWKRWSREELTEASFQVVDQPLLDAGLNTEAFFLRMFFTHNANRYIKSGASRASPREIVRWMLRVEQGRLVDEFSSLELKKMLYLTRRRVRYAYAPILRGSAVWFKSGSLYICREEPGFTCMKYRGNVTNVLNGLIEVETPPPPPPEPPPETVEEVPPEPELAGPPVPEQLLYKEPEHIPHVYIVAVMSNELKRNAATDHGLLAAAIHEVIIKE